MNELLNIIRTHNNAVTAGLHSQVRAMLRSMANAHATQMEAAVRSMAIINRGKGDNFSRASGTGGGRHARGSAKLEFSQNASSQPCP